MLIKKISILSRFEAKFYENVIPKTRIAWRLNTPGIYDNYTYCIDSSGNVFDCDIQSSIGVRPALWIIFNDKPSVSDKIELFNHNWTVIGNLYEGTLVLCDDVICCRRYDRDNNKWEKSELKDWLEDWLKEQDGVNCV